MRRNRLVNKWQIHTLRWGKKWGLFGETINVELETFIFSTQVSLHFPVLQNYTLDIAFFQKYLRQLPETTVLLTSASLNKIFFSFYKSTTCFMNYCFILLKVGISNPQISKVSKTIKKNCMYIVKIHWTSNFS